MGRARRDLTTRSGGDLEYASFAGPKTNLVASLIVLLILAGCVSLVHYTYDDRKALPDSAESSIGYTAMDRHFPLTSIIPQYVFIQSPHDLRTPQALADMEQMAQRISQLPNIAIGPGGHPAHRSTAGSGQHDASGRRSR